MSVLEQVQKMLWAFTASFLCVVHHPCPSCPPCGKIEALSALPDLRALTQLKTVQHISEVHPRFSPHTRDVKTFVPHMVGTDLCDPTLDDPGERRALISLYHTTGGLSTWRHQGLFLNASLSICCWMPMNGSQSIQCTNGRVTTLQLASNGLVGTVDVSGFPQMTFLALYDNGITALRGLETLVRLKSMFLYVNQITSLPGLYALTQLVELDLHKNQLTTVPGLQGLTLLSMLDINSNQLTQIAGLQALTRLTMLALHINRLSALPDLRALTQLKKLLLYTNHLTVVPGLSALTRLRQLSLHGNQFTAVQGLQTLTELTWLDLSGNQLISVPALQVLTKVTEVYLHNNKLRQLPFNLSWAQVKYLTLYENALTSLPATMSSFPTLLKQLLLLHNQLTSLPMWVARIPSLRILDVSHNQLTSIPDFSPANLTSLLLVNNHLSLPVMQGRLHTIPLLDVSSNPLNAPLDQVLGNLTRSETVSLFAATNCSLQRTYIPSKDTAVVLSHLVSLDIHDNPQFDLEYSEDLIQMLPVLGTLDVSHTSCSFDLDYPQLRSLRAAGIPPHHWPTSAATSSNLQLLDGTGTEWTEWTSYPIDDVQTDASQLVRFPLYNALTCPSWRFKVSKGLFRIGPSFGQFRSCHCLDGHYFRRSKKWRCEPCPDHLLCNTSSDSFVLHNIDGNFYPVVAIPGNYSGASLATARFVRCHFPVCNTVSITEAGQFTCAEGHDSNSLLCSKCKSGYFAGRGTCSKCHASFVVLVPLALFIALIAFILYIATHNPKRRGHLVSIVSFWLQLMALLQDSTQASSSSSGNMTTTSNSFQRNRFQIVLQDLASFRPWALECTLGNNHWNYFVSSWCLLLIPFVVPLVIKLAYFTQATDRDREWVWQYRTLYVWELLYVPVSSRVFALFNCVHNDALSHRFLSSEPWISCSDSHFVALRSVAIFVLIVYVLALPVVSFRGITQDLAPFQFMKQSFHEHTWWWQAVVWRVRALALVMFVQLLPYDSVFIPILVWVLLLVSISLNLLYRPYLLRRDAWLMTALLVMSTIIYQTSIIGTSFANNTGAAIFVQVCYVWSLLFVVIAFAGAVKMNQQDQEQHENVLLEDLNFYREITG